MNISKKISMVTKYRHFGYEEKWLFETSWNNLKVHSSVDKRLDLRLLFDKSAKNLIIHSTKEI